MTHPSFWIGTSWKMHKTLAEALVFARALAAADTDRDPRIQRFVIPSFTAVREVGTALTGSSVRVGAQNMHWAEDGAWTGEISAPMLVDCGIDLVELGHPVSHCGLHLSSHGFVGLVEIVGKIVL